MLKRRQIRAIKRAFHKLFKRTWNFITTVSKSVVDWFLRTVLLMGIGKQRPANAKAGFVLPTVAMLLLVVSLVVGAILLRTGSRTNQIIGAREEQIIYNAATPAVERARAKLEYLFLKDKRFPSGAPSDEMLLSMLNNQPIAGLTYQVNPDPYTLPGETRLDLDGGGNDPAWSYQVDTDGDGRQETVVYSILLKRRNDINANIRLENSSDLDKARALVVRNGPINTTDVSNPICARVNQSQQNNNNATQIRPVNDGDWFPVGSGTLRKTFQVDAIVISNKAGTSRTVATLEFQQDRQLSRANTGAWFRYDLEIFPGNPFRWNGSMYTAGNLIVGGSEFFRSYLISSPDSCFYDSKFPGASEITIYESANQNVNDPNNPDFQGQVLSGSYQINGYGGSSLFDVLKDDGSPNITAGQTRLDPSKDSVLANKTLPDTAVDPKKLLTEDKVQARRDQFSNRNTRDPGWNSDAAPGQLGYFRTRKRIYNRAGQVPFIDDTYRADDRYGPKPTYGRNKEVVVSSGQMGQNVTGADAALLTSNTIDPLDTEFRNLGWDGYWERRAWAAGLRLIVGQRLELGNPFAPFTPLTSAGDPNPLADPLYQPSPGVTIKHQDQQHRTLRDNLAAVQATAVYHVANPAGKEVPVACVATTAHPGTRVTVDNSKNFQLAGNKYQYLGQPAPLYTDFFTGLGTNGWEFNPPAVAGNGTLTNGALTDALRRLANFAGDPEGAFPPVQQGGQINPNPLINSGTGEGTMWGDFSNLRRALNGNNSIADKSYIHSAACTVGMLAYNIQHIENYSYTATNVAPNLQALNTALNGFMDGNPANGELTNPETRTPDEFINKLREQSVTNTALVPLVPVAEVVALKQQIIRDRNPNPLTPTPTSFTVPAFDPDNDGNPANNVTTLQSACDPAATFPGITNLGALTRLCPTQAKFPILNAIFPSGTPVAPSVLQPKLVGQPWQLPTQPNPPANPNQNYFVITDPNNTRVRVPLGDTGFFNGREVMTVRTLDIDLDLLRRNQIGSDFWLPNSGIVYAFREDGVREDAIARSPGGTQTNTTNSGAASDPPLENGVSIKPVDFVPDPDRRPHGFRLRNGQNIRRAVDNPRGLSFVSDNPVYIQGNFNYHSTDGNSNNLEEFTDPLDLDNWTNFYTRRNLDERFARGSTDTWRPSEILADAITILSGNFQEGNIASGITNDTNPTTTVTTDGRYSFRAVNGPTTQQLWVREDNTIIPTGTAAANSPIPIKINRNGAPMFCPTAPAAGTTLCTNPQPYTGTYRPINTDYRDSAINQANETRINAMLVSGIVPSRENQSYGGFHNFPRFIERWSAQTRMIISGSFVQLNFSNYATAPFSLNAWEPGQAPGAEDPTDPASIRYYRPPGRRWGYDVGLQYAPAGPIAQRLVLPPASRSEFYRDLEANDPYICRLRLALNRVNGQDAVAQQECQ